MHRKIFTQPQAQKVVQKLNTQEIEQRSDNRRVKSISKKRKTFTEQIITNPQSMPHTNTQENRNNIEHETEFINANSSQKSHISFYQNWSIAELVQHSKQGQQHRSNELQSLKITLKKIMKTNEQYRQKIIKLHEQKITIKLENVVLTKEVEHLTAEKQTWQTQKLHFQNLQQNYKSQNNLAKQNYNKSYKRMLSDIEKLTENIQFEKKRNSDLEKYNKDLFSQISSSNAKVNQKINQNKFLQLTDLLTKKQYQIKMTSQSMNKIRIDYENIYLNNQYLQQIQRQHQQRLHNFTENQIHFKSKIDQLELQIKNLKNQNHQIKQNRNKENSQLSRQVESYLNAKQILLNKIKQHQKTILSLSNQKQKRQNEEKNRIQLQAKLFELQRKNSQIERFFAQQKAQKQNKINEMEKQKSLFQQKHKQQISDHSFAFEQAAIDYNNKLVEYSNLLVSEQQRSQQLQNNLIKAYQEIQKLTQMVVNYKRQNQVNTQSLSKKQQQIRQQQMQILTKQAKIAQVQVKINNQIKINSQIKQQLYKSQKQTQLLILNLQNSQQKQRQQQQKLKKQIQQQLQQACRKLQENDSKYNNAVTQIHQKAQKLRMQLESLNTIHTNNQKVIQQKDNIIETKYSALQRLNMLIENLKQQIKNLQTDKLKLTENVRILQNEIQNLSNKLKEKINENSELSKDIQMRVLKQQDFKQIIKQKEIEINKLINKTEIQNEISENLNTLIMNKNTEISQAQNIISQKTKYIEILMNDYSTELDFLRLANEQLKTKYQNNSTKSHQIMLKLESQLKKYQNQQRRLKISQENYQNLLSEIEQSQKVTNQLNHPPPISIKKFINLVNITHRPNFNRQIQKVLHYFNKIEQTKASLQKHYNNMKFISNLIQQKHNAANLGKVITLK